MLPCLSLGKPLKRSPRLLQMYIHVAFRRESRGCDGAFLLQRCSASPGQQACPLSLGLA